MPTNSNIRLATVEDASQIVAIYNHYVRDSIVTFDESEMDKQQMATKMAAVLANYTWIVYESENTIVGYAYADIWKPRSAYKHSVEASVYLHPDHTGQGIGRALYTELLELLKQKNIHTVIGGIALPNEPSVILHEKFGFQKVAHFREVGWKFGKWIDVGYWQLNL